jgi:hypothetical protein
MTMRRKPIVWLFAAVILLPGLAGAVSEKDFEARTTENLMNLCTASPDEPLYHHKKSQEKAYDEGFKAGQKSQ